MENKTGRAGVKGETAQRKSEDRTITIIWAALLIFILAYAAANVLFKTNVAVLGVGAFILFILAILAESRTSIKHEGGKKTLLEIGGVVLSVLILFAIVAVVLHTSSPIDVIASCSMLPSFHRGDLVVLHGIGNMSSFLDAYRIPVVNVSQAAYSAMVNDMQSEFLQPYADVNGNLGYILQNASLNASSYSIGLYSLPCLASHQGGHVAGYGSCLVTPAEESKNLIGYNYALARLAANAGNASIIYVPSITIGNITVVENYSNPVIVYKATKLDYFSGDIIHRVFAAMRVGSNYYLLTKGDNNPILDIESLNYPVNASSVVGYVVGHIPYVAYPSLILKGQVGNVPGCNQTIVR